MLAPTSSVVTNRCTNCGNNMHQQQTFCEKCGNTSKVVNVGGINTTSESKFVSHETIFGTDFRGTNIGSRTGKTSSLLLNYSTIFCFVVHNYLSYFKTISMIIKCILYYTLREKTV